MQAFIDQFETVARAAHENARAKGFWPDGQDCNDGEKIALIHSEVSEALEGLRAGNPPSDKIPTFNCAEEEFADAIIRMMDFSVRRGWRIAQAVIAKMEYNASRPFKHGKAY